MNIYIYTDTDKTVTFPQTPTHQYTHSQERRYINTQCLLSDVWINLSRILFPCVYIHVQYDGILIKVSKQCNVFIDV